MTLQVELNFTLTLHAGAIAKRPGFVPLIISVKPLKDLNSFLGAPSAIVNQT